MTDNEQLIAQARVIHAKAMNCSDFADEGQWRAAEDVIDPPLHNYWRVTAVRAPHQKGIEPYPVTKALTQEPGVAGLLTFVSTALPQLCDLVERLADQAREALAGEIAADERGDKLLEALTRNRAALDLIDPMRPLQYAATMDLMRKDMDAAIAKASGGTA